MSKRKFMEYELLHINNSKKKKFNDKEEENVGKKNSHITAGFFDHGEQITIRDNHIYFYGDVTTSNCLRLNTSIRDINKKLKTVRDDYDMTHLRIFLHINSYGGSVFAALATIDTIITSEVPIISIIEGCAASAATLISVVCHEREIMPYSFMLVHQISSGFWGKFEEIKDEMLNLKKLTKTIKKIYKKYTHLKNKKINDNAMSLNDILKRDLWWDSEDCLNFGLVDRIKE